MNKVVNVFLVLGMVFASIVGVTMSANAAEEKCYDTVHVDATYKEVIVQEYVAAIPAGPSLWWNWSPNKDQGPFDGPPAFPVDERGTWQGPHTEGGPSQDTFGTFQQGEGHGSWFHREAGTPAVAEIPEIKDTVVDVPAHDDKVEVDCPPVVVPPVEPPVTDNPPVKDKPKPVVTESTPKEDIPVNVDKELPATGGPSVGILIGGAILLAAGGVLLYRRKV